MITIGSKDASVPVYRAEPEGACRGGLLLIHEVWGLTDHIRSVADRFADEGYLVSAPNLLSDTDIEQHLTPQMAQDLFNPEKRNAVQPKLRELMTPIQTPEFGAATVAKLQDCFKALFDEPECDGRVAVIGYCFGGTYSFNLAVVEPRLKAAVPYYGHASQSADELKSIACPVLAFYGENDEALISALPDLKDRMRTAGADFTVQVYSGCGHAFFNDSNPFAYDEAAATDAWQRTLKFLDAALGGGSV